MLLNQDFARQSPSCSEPLAEFIAFMVGVRCLAWCTPSETQSHTGSRHLERASNVSLVLPGVPRSSVRKRQ